jgi:hypothetical protein
MTQGPFVPIGACAKHFAVSVSTIRSWVKQGFIPRDTYVTIGLTYRFDLPAVIKALSATPADNVQEKSVEVAVEVDVKHPVQLELNFNPDKDL